MVTEEDSFSRYCRANPIPNKEAHTDLMDQHFNIYLQPDQLHSDNGKEFVNNLWRELFSEFKIQHTTTPLYNPSSNPVEHFHWTLTAMLRTRGPGVLDTWDLELNASVFVYNTTMSSSTGVSPHKPCSGARQHYLWIGSTSNPLQRREQFINGQGTCWKKDNMPTGL